MSNSMLLDGFMPDFDATRIEQRVIDARPAAVYEAAIRVDLVDVMRRSRIVRGLFAGRAAGERLSAIAHRRPVAPHDVPVMRLAELRNAGNWIRLAERPPNEFAFGAIGRFWSGETIWEEIASADFPSFDKPGYAKIAANLSLRPYGNDRTLLSYEARTQATDDAARRAFLRYWTFASLGAGVVMRAALKLIADEVAESGAGM
ncbi:MAG: hypothetical protein QOH13_668 [Thermoleophilaceae bacterium]|jgi:hypothetical protein|nr:hypothetical protein [Thermoleophilaceae bacterium]